MTRRRVIFYNDLNGSWVVSEEYNGAKAEAESFGLGLCDRNWDEFMDAMSTVKNLADFLKVISFITGSYHATINGIPVPEQANQLPGSRLFVAHNKKELYDKVQLLDEVWEVKRNIPGAHLLDVPAIAPIIWDGKEVLDTDTFSYKTAKPGDYVTQDVVDDAMDCLPPVCMRSDCSQMGEPYSSKYDERSGKWRNTYATFSQIPSQRYNYVPRENRIWIYHGHCFCGETEERGQDMPVIAVSNGGNDNG